MKVLFVGNIQGLRNGTRTHQMPQRLLHGFVRARHNVYLFNDREVARSSTIFGSRKFGIVPMNRKLLALCRAFEPDLLQLALVYLGLLWISQFWSRGGDLLDLWNATRQLVLVGLFVVLSVALFREIPPILDRALKVYAAAALLAAAAALAYAVASGTILGPSSQGALFADRLVAFGRAEHAISGAALAGTAHLGCNSGCAALPQLYDLHVLAERRQKPHQACRAVQPLAGLGVAITASTGFISRPP